MNKLFQCYLCLLFFVVTDIQDPDFTLPPAKEEDKQKEKVYRQDCEKLRQKVEG